jgi:hypothetical protein
MVEQQSSTGGNDKVKDNPKHLSEAQALYYHDLARLRGQRGALMELLIDGQWHPNHECSEVGGLSFQCSIYAFRREGWIIESRWKKAGLWEYRLTGKGDPPPQRMSRAQRTVAARYSRAIEDEAGDEILAAVNDSLPAWMQVGTDTQAR